MLNVAGLGFGLTFTPAIVSLGQYFEKNRNMVFAVASCGVGLGTVVFASLAQNLIRALGWRMTMLILSAVLALNFVVTALMRPFKHAPVEPIVAEVTFEAIEKALEAQHDTKDIGLNDVINAIQSISQRYENILASFDNPTSQSKASKHSSRLPEVTPKLKPSRRDSVVLVIENKPNAPESWVSVYLNASFVSFIVSLALMGTGISCVYTHFPAYVTSNGGSESQASQCISLMGFGGIAGRLVVGGLSNKWTGHVSHMTMTSCVIAAMIVLTAPFMGTSFALLATLSFVFALFANCFFPLMGSMCVALVGLEHLNVAYGVAMISCGGGFLAGPPVAGRLSYRVNVLLPRTTASMCNSITRICLHRCNTFMCMLQKNVFIYV